VPNGDPPRRVQRITVQPPSAPTYTLGPQTITLPFPLSIEVLDRLLFRAAIERIGSGRAAAKLLGRSEGWAAAAVGLPLGGAIHDASVLRDKHYAIEAAVRRVAAHQLLQLGRTGVRHRRWRHAGQHHQEPCRDEKGPPQGSSPFRGVRKDGAGHLHTSRIKKYVLDAAEGIGKIRQVFRGLCGKRALAGPGETDHCAKYFDDMYNILKLRLSDTRMKEIFVAWTPK
jgi:hypothetical protein